VGVPAQHPAHAREHRIGWAGALALTVGVIPVLVVAEQGQDWGWDSAPAILCYVVAIAIIGTGMCWSTPTAM
jgi:hypothetical protein